MLTIEYVMRQINRYTNAPLDVTLCGHFRDIEHFQKFLKVEEYREWHVVKYDILKVD